MLTCGSVVAPQNSVTLPSRTWLTLAAGTRTELSPAGSRQRTQRHGVLVVGEHIVDVEPERASCLLGQPAEESQLELAGPGNR